MDDTPTPPPPILPHVTTLANIARVLLPPIVPPSS
jgi:hypothetical protein